MNYFAAISKRAEELDAIGQVYLDGLPFIDNETVCERLWNIAWEIEESDQDNPEWVDFAIDGHIPYASRQRNGSIYYSLGFAMVANDACLRNFLEVAEGRESEYLDLEVIAEKPIVKAMAS